MNNIYKYLFFFCFSLTLSTVAVAAANTQGQYDTVVEKEAILVAATPLSQASEYFVQKEHCGVWCKRSLKKFAKSFIKTLNNYDVESQNDAQQVLALIVGAAHELNQKNPDEGVRNLFLNDFWFSNFQVHITNAINKREFKLWQKALLVIAGITIVVTGAAALTLGVFAVGFLSTTTSVLVLDTAIAALILTGAAGSYYLVAKPINQSYNQSHTDEKRVEELKAYLKEIEISSSSNEQLMP